MDEDRWIALIGITFFLTMMLLEAFGLKPPTDHHAVYLPPPVL